MSGCNRIWLSFGNALRLRGDERRMRRFNLARLRERCRAKRGGEGKSNLRRAEDPISIKAGKSASRPARVIAVRNTFH